MSVGFACAAALVLTPAPAQAASLNGVMVVSAGADTSPPTCSGDDGDSAQAAFASDGVAVNESVAFDGTVTDSGDAADITEWSASSKGNVKSSQTGQTTQVALTAKLAVSVDADQGDTSDCAVDADAAMVVQAIVDVPNSGWLNLSVTNPDDVVVGYAVQSISSGGMSGTQVTWLGQQTTKSKVWMSSGSYLVLLQVQAYADDDSTTPDPSSVSANVALKASIAPPGLATGKAAGPGKGYVDLGSGVNCLDRTVSGVFTKKASKIDTATFFVNGKKKATVKKPSPNTAVILTGIGATEDAVVKVVLKPKGKSKAVSTTRSYLACS